MESNQDRKTRCRKIAATSAAKSRERAIQAYLANPVRCRFCGEVIPVADNEKPSETRKRTFCNASCAASFNNRGRIRNPQGGTPPQRGVSPVPKPCVRCGEPTTNAKFCSKSCRFQDFDLEGVTKGDLFKTRPNWQAARSAIQKNARQVLFAHDPKPKCKVCGYDKHIEVAHVKPVKGFPATALISEINHLDNLLPLCPNHHWEHDHPGT